MKKLLTFRLVFLPFLAFALVAWTSGNDDRPYKTVLKGTVEGRDGERIVIMPRNVGIRDYTEQDVVVVENGKFERLVEGDNMVMYQVLFEKEYMTGSWHMAFFFPDAPQVVINVIDWNGNDHEPIGGEINEEMNRYNKERKENYLSLLEPVGEKMDSLMNAGSMISAEAMELHKQRGVIVERLYKQWSDEDNLAEIAINVEIEKLKKQGKYYTPEFTVLIEEYDSIVGQNEQHEYKYIRENINLFSYSMLYNFVCNSGEDSDMSHLDSLFTRYAEHYPGHPYTEYISEVLKGNKAMRVGQPFVDFSAPDLNGDMHTLSEEIKGKIAYIDLWASWCGPCRRNSVEMIPLYEKYKDKGFIIVGVAREMGDTDAMAKAIAKDGYLWLNLVELDDANSIWNKYAAWRSAGKTVLVDSDGTILEIDKNARFMKEYLEKKFGY